ncbi:synaptophysin-like [Cyprinodon tularosa]|uniref:synaptophysin-like n=1 Tax=Cyprinodon tularosa TaxID=77115 RepID=UPI0018E22228|nr:synaptophysin-like [Cyprinodon tularosa]XP_038154378.1 synaptophysin-like [Cyprinodon tularosa]XP_038154379.1 synaptophysin-like [Cyprinodon tularosa]XP_038154380.1 synaptophysin-like [Cyprinodon tularosa]XP_038154381.1 synaptophysin-like [Cyprinodon tularosa]XP_038154382.1 synaptophysin-like [Cyprinodon tularosa]XP_038154384.1 synaptophysin-like [Cyprinodon tularosa]XP_038154385.1 synaptophysin-like [Cyprinodon tularosa]
MDVVNQLMAQGQFRILKVPLGFIKVLEWFFAIFAFSTCGSYSGMFKVSVDCKNLTESNLGVKVEFEYPFRLHQVYFTPPTCTGGTEQVFLVGDYSSSAEFFVTIGVFAFLYSTAALSIYLFFYEKYKENNKGPLIDLGVTAAFAFMWLVSSAAWAKGLSDVKTATDPDDVITMIAACKEKANTCREVHDPVMSGLNTSVAFGFINLVLWAGNIWFVFKETGIIAPFMRAPPPPEKPAPDAYGQQGAYEPDPYASNQGGYQPEYNQQGYNQEADYGQGMGQQGAPTSFSNQM